MKIQYTCKNINLIICCLLFIGITSAVSAQQPDPPPAPQTWTAGQTSVSQLSPEEQKKMLGVLPEVSQWEAEQAARYRQTAPLLLFTYPAQIDWRDVGGEDFTTAVKDQGPCGACVAFAVNGAIESRLEVFNNNPLLDQDLSEDHLFFCGHGEHCGGWSPLSALDVAGSTGIVDEACQPYDPTSMSCDPCSDWEDRVTKIAGYRMVYDPDEAKKLISADGAIIATFNVYDDFYSYQSGVYQYTWGPYSGAHAVAVVGYDDSEGYWIAKNSWGTDWGENGWFRIAYGEVAFDDAFYVPVIHPPAELFLSPNREASVQRLPFERSDILRDDIYGYWSTLFDASDLGIPITSDLHGFSFAEDGSILMVFDTDTSLQGLAQPATPWQVVRFRPTSLGMNTAGSFENCPLDGTGQLSTDGEMIDALHVQDNALYLSVAGAYSINQGETILSGGDEDILKFTPDGALCQSGGTWSQMLDNGVEQIQGLAEEDVNALWLDQSYQPHIALTNDFVIMDVIGYQKDVLQLQRDGAGAYIGADLIWHGPSNDGYQSMVDGLFYGDYPNILPPSIFGTVTSEEDGQPLQGISVEIYEESDGYWERLSVTTTNVDGTYEVFGLPSGIYRIGFSDDYTITYAPEFYNDQLVLELAEDINVPSGSSAGSIDAALDLEGSISGTVTNEMDGQPLEGISVYAYIWDGNSRYYVTQVATDSSGGYELAGLHAGDYVVWFWDWSYQFIQEKYDNAPDFYTATAVTVAAGLDTPSIDAALMPNSHITGSVTAEIDGTPLEGIDIELYRNNDGSWDYEGWTQTDAAGFYDLGELSAGTYRIGFFDYTRTYADEYYNDAATLESASDISVTEGNVTSGIDAQLTLNGSISGTVTGGISGSGLEGIYVEGFIEIDDSWEWTASTVTNPDGTYVLPGLVTGTYRVSFTDWNSVYASEFYDDASTLETATDVSVTSGIVTPGIDAQLALRGSIAGTVTDEVSGIGLEGIFVDVYYFDIWDEMWYVWTGTETAADGTYQVSGLETGTYRVGFYDDSGTYLEKYFDDAISVDVATDVAVTPGTVTSGIDAQLALAGSIAGTVTEEIGGNGLEGIEVTAYLVIDDDYDWQGNAWTLPDGSYQINGLKPGIYHVQFQDYDTYIAEYYDDAATLETATDITVTNGSLTPGIDAQLSMGGIISGKVTREDDGTDISGIRVKAFMEQGGDWIEIDNYSWTGEDGTYEVRQLKGGSYRIRFSDDSLQYAVEYYDGAPDLASANDISINLGQTISGINAALNIAPPPTNDDFDNALIVPGLPYYHAIEQGIPTTAVDDPALPCGPGDQGGASVWYQYTPATDELLNADTFGSYFDTVLAIWQGQRGSLTNVACNDDLYLDYNSELLDISLTGGTTYFIEVASYGSGWGTMLLNLYRSGTTTQEISLLNGWNMTSACVNPQNPDLDDIFAEIMDDLVLVKNGFGEVYWPEFNVNQIGQWQVEQGYMIYMRNGRTLSVSGSLADTPIDLNAGWNMVAYLEEQDMDIVQALASIEGSIFLVKDFNEGVYWPDQGINTIGDMHPGEGYQMYMKDADTLIYP